MKAVVLIPLFLILASVASSSEMGLELPFAKKRTGSPDFDVLFQYEADVSWVFRYRSQVPGERLKPWNGTVYWTLYDQSRKKNLFSWREMQRWKLAHGELTLRQRSILSRLLPRQNRITILFAEKNQDKMVPLYHVNLRSLCHRHPSHFTDISQGGVSTCRVELPSEWLRECHKIRHHYKIRVTSDLNTCEEAREAVWRFGCGEFACPRVKAGTSF